MADELTGRQLYDDGVRLFLVLDVDGVIVPRFRWAHYPADKFDDFRAILQSFEHPYDYLSSDVIVDMAVTYSPAMISRLNTILADSRVQLCWLTSWRERILATAENMGLVSARPPLVIDWKITFSGDDYYKGSYLVDFLRGVPKNAGVIWVDDKMKYFRRWSTQIRTKRRCIGPDDNYGLSKPEMAQIEDFARATLAEHPRIGG